MGILVDGGVLYATQKLVKLVKLACVVLRGGSAGKYDTWGGTI